MSARLTLCYCDLPFNKGRPVFAICDRCEAARLEAVLERRGLVARERADHPALDAFDELAASYHDRAADDAAMHTLGGQR